ncbi:hypothetical protein CEXT_637601 [Caerostris extrusa]|uniref:Uncharacterized protein n=1 Tax=Caerostris extrusa TaxID=172846 RepID=A0AAV4RLC2_CAEEX|nr:hypothetical protein CEXT_637601 [Caerostris extrusa]
MAPNAFLSLPPPLFGSSPIDAGGGINEIRWGADDKISFLVCRSVALFWAEESFKNDVGCFNMIQINIGFKDGEECKRDSTPGSPGPSLSNYITRSDRKQIGGGFRRDLAERQIHDAQGLISWYRISFVGRGSSGEIRFSRRVSHQVKGEKESDDFSENSTY